MSSSDTTSAVEDVGSGVQGNIRAHGEPNLIMGQRGTETNTHTHSYWMKSTNPNEAERTAMRQRRTGQWRGRSSQDKKAKMFRRSAAGDRQKTEPNHKDLMTVVNKESRFVKVKEKELETNRMKREIMAHQGQQAVVDAPNQKVWKQGGHGYIDDVKPDDIIRVIL